MHKQLLVLSFLALLFSCIQNKPQQKQLLDFGRFTIETPLGWTKVKQQGTDSYIGQVAIDEKDTLEFDLGWYSWDLKEYEEFNFNGKKFYMSSTDTAAKLIDSAHKDELVKSNVTFTTIDNRRAKILTPIKSGIGTTGIYIDSLWLAGSAIEKFSLYGFSLKSTNERDVLEAFKTLKFVKTK